MDEITRRKLADNIGALRLIMDGLKEDTLSKDEIVLMLGVVSKGLTSIVSQSINIGE